MEDRSTTNRDGISFDEWMQELDRVQTGSKCVYEDRRRKRGRFNAYGSYKSKRYNLGGFNTPSEAVLVVQEFKADPEKWLRKKGKLE